jgi:hypothetical protein
MLQVEEKIKQSLERKDKIIENLKSKNEEIQSRNRNLEHLIEKQRLEFLS